MADGPEMGGAIIGMWQSTNMPPDPFHIYPDGCRDVIWHQLAGAAPRWRLSSLDRVVRVFKGAGGASMRGFRLAPGAFVDPRLFDRLDPENPEVGESVITTMTGVSPDVAEFMAACRAFPGSGVADLARQLGVSVRSLQRMAKVRTGQSPLFWLRLRRLQRALAYAAGGFLLAEAAFEAGFADQAHFTREARHVHGATPARLLRNSDALEAILVPGL